MDSSGGKDADKYAKTRPIFNLTLLTPVYLDIFRDQGKSNNLLAFFVLLEATEFSDSPRSSATRDATATT